MNQSFKDSTLFSIIYMSACIYCFIGLLIGMVLFMIVFIEGNYIYEAVIITVTAIVAGIFIRVYEV